MKILKTLTTLIYASVIQMHLMAETVSIPLEADMYVSKNPSSPVSYGKEQNLTVGGINGNAFITFIKLPTTKIQPNFQKATLVLTTHPANAFPPQTTMSLYLLNTAWSETNFAPMTNISGWFDQTLGAPPHYGYGEYRIDVTRIIIAMKSWGYPTHGIVLVPNNRSPVYLNNFFSREVPWQSYQPRVEVVYPAQFKLGFPVKDTRGNLLSPYTTVVTSIMDHDMTTGRMTTLLGQKSSSMKWISVLGLNFGVISGGFNQGPFVYAYDSNRALVAYDNHDGYDYRIGDSNYFVAPADGVAYIGSSNMTPSTVTLWRNSKYTSPQNRNYWDSSHAIYIDHGNGYVSYSYHCSDIVTSPINIKQQILNQGYALVKKGDRIAVVGGYMNGRLNGVSPHLHFGVYKNNILVDPYGGFEGNPVLWEVTR